MKKLMSVILTVIVAVTMIGSATVNAQAEAEATCVADVVAFMKECQPGESLTWTPVDNCTITYSWVYTDPKEVEAWLLLLTDEEKTELYNVLDKAGATIDDISGWQVQEMKTQSRITWLGSD